MTSDQHATASWAADRAWAGIAAAGVFGLLALQYTPHWTPGGDSDFYLAVARNVARGDGLTYNGMPVAISPPGWPWLLGGLMRISTSFAFLNLVQGLMLWAGLVLLYPLARCVVNPAAASGAVVMSAVLHPVYTLGGWMHAEPAYLLAANGSVVAGLLCARARGGPALALFLLTIGLAVAAVFLRWTGLFHWILASAALASGAGGHVGVLGVVRRIGPGVAGGLVVVATFWVLWTSLAVTRDVARPAYADLAQPVAQPQDEPDARPADEAVQEALGHGEFLADRDTAVLGQYAMRLASAGTWASWLAWYPFRFGSALPGVTVAVAVSGWVLVGLLVLAATGPRTPAAGRWLLAGVITYACILAVVWPNPNARYLMPVTPVLLAGVLAGAARLDVRLAWFFTATVLAVNVPLYAFDAYLARASGASMRFFEAGTAATLVEACRVASADGAQGGEVVVSERHVNFGRTRRLRTGARAAHFLLDRDLRMLPAWIVDDPQRGALPRQLGSLGVRYFLHQEPSDPWRLWHLRLPEALQKRLTGQPAGGGDGRWVLYRVIEAEGEWRFEEINVHKISGEPAWPRRVPGM